MSEEAQAPQIPKLVYVRHIGRGGYSDVFLYRQSVPARDVAVKVLRPSEGVWPDLDVFRAEADAMARLSHPAIVPIYAADVASDGRPYIVMEYSSHPNLSVQAKEEPLSVANSLDIGVKVAAALETAHRAGVVHRDVKPHNILVNNYGAPMLTDFGIASDLTGKHASASSALSLRWASPESLADDPQVDARSDVYSLAATIYTLLIGSSPFERRTKGADNGSEAIQSRILNERPSPIRRSDVPASLKRLLMSALARDPAARPASALGFAEALVGIQAELGLAASAIDLPLMTPAADAPVVPVATGAPDESTVDRRSLPPVADTSPVWMPSGSAASASPVRLRKPVRPWRFGLIAGAMLALLGFGAAMAAVAVSNSSTPSKVRTVSPADVEPSESPEPEPSSVTTTPPVTPAPAPAPIRRAPVPTPPDEDDEDYEDYLEDRYEDYCEDNSDSDYCDEYDDEEYDDDYDDEYDEDDSDDYDDDSDDDESDDDSDESDDDSDEDEDEDD